MYSNGEWSEGNKALFREQVNLIAQGTATPRNSKHWCSMLRHRGQDTDMVQASLAGTVEHAKNTLENILNDYSDILRSMAIVEVP